MAHTRRISCMLGNCKTKESFGGNLWQVDGGYSLEYSSYVQDLEHQLES